MKVFVVLEFERGEGDSITSIHANREDAEKKVAISNGCAEPKTKWPRFWSRVEEHEVATQDSN